MLAIMGVFLFVISTSSAIPQNRPRSDNHDWVENLDFYDDSENNREKRDLVENPEFYEEFPYIPFSEAFAKFANYTTTEFYDAHEKDSISTNTEFSGNFPPISDTTTSIPFQENENEGERQLVYAKFHSFGDTVDLQWADNTKKTVELKKLDDDCHYQGSFKEDPKSVILITGCEYEKQSIQIQSVFFGDTLATTTNGTLEMIFGADLREDMVDNPAFEEENMYTDDYIYNYEGTFMS